MLAERGRIDPRANRYGFLAEATPPAELYSRQYCVMAFLIAAIIGMAALLYVFK